MDELVKNCQVLNKKYFPCILTIVGANVGSSVSIVGD